MLRDDDPAIFHRTHPCPGEPYDQYRLVSLPDGPFVFRDRVTPFAFQSGKSRVEEKARWAMGDFLCSDVLPAAKTALQRLLEARQ